MVWARSKLLIEDDILRPLPIMKIKFSGQNPERFYKQIYNLLLVSFRISTDSVQEKDFQWSKGETEKFKITWEVNKDLDKFSYYHINITLSGESSKNSGKADIEIDGVVRTEYPQDTMWQKSLLYEILRMFWHSTFYSSKRDEYLKEGRRLMSLFCDQLKALSRV